jgi:hypothetical protein
MTEKHFAATKMRRTQMWEQHISNTRQNGDGTEEQKSNICSIKIEYDSHIKHRGHRPLSHLIIENQNRVFGSLSLN